MTDIPPVSGSSGTLSLRPPQAGRRAGEAEAAEPADRLDLSDLGEALSRLEADSDIRVEKVAVLREAIANDTYLTDDKIRVTVERLLDDLRSND